MSFFEQVNLVNIAKALINPSTEEKQDDGITAIGLLPQASNILDFTTNAVNTVDYAHHEIHGGKHFFVKNWIDLTNGQVLDFLFVTADTLAWAHMIVHFNFQAEANVAIYEDTVVSANGTAVTSYNRNRNSANVAGALVYSTPTVTSVGTLLSAYKAGSGKAVGGEARGSAELVLKQNSQYLIRVTNDTTSNNWFDYLADWYEHTNK